MSVRFDTTAAQILQIFKRRLIDAIEELHEGACMVSDEPIPLVSPPTDVFCTVSLGDGTYIGSYFSGGGVSAMYESTSLDVSVISRCKAEEPKRFENRYLQTETGLISYWLPAIHSALLVEWEPEDERGPLLRDKLAPAKRSGPRMANLDPRVEHDCLMMTLSYDVAFDWRLEKDPKEPS